MMASRRSAILFGGLLMTTVYHSLLLAAGPVPAEQVAAIERACERLVLDYAHYRDTNDGDAYAALFADDASLVFPRASSKGRAIIRRDFDRQSAIPWRRHVTTNIRIAVLDADHAEGTSYVTVYGGGRSPEAGASAPPLDGPSAIGEYRDRYIRTPAGWRFAERTFTPVLVSEALARTAAPAPPLPPK
jgi:hypothetical protein